MKKYGLIGYPLSHSFSREYFKNKFEKEGIQDCRYDAYELPDFGTIHDLIADPELLGLNITIPHKVRALSLVNDLDPVAARIGAINVMKRMKDGSWKGYNTDYYGILAALGTLKTASLWQQKMALILGTGGSSMATEAALKFLGMQVYKVSRNPRDDQYSYDNINTDLLSETHLLVNCTPLGMHPKIHEAPPLPYGHLSAGTYALDLIYNPEKTLFLERCEKQGLKILNGLPVLIAQAEKSWEIWQS